MGSLLADSWGRVPDALNSYIIPEVEGDAFHLDVLGRRASVRSQLKR